MNIELKNIELPMDQQDKISILEHLTEEQLEDTTFYLNPVCGTVYSEDAARALFNDENNERFRNFEKELTWDEFGMVRVNWSDDEDGFEV